MRSNLSKSFVCLLSLILLASLSTGVSAEGICDVKGTIKGTKVKFDSAVFDGQLALSDGDGWAFNPSVLVFFFDKVKGLPTGKTVHVSSSDGFSSPHVHLRWTDKKSRDIDVEILSEGYRMSVEFGKVKKGMLLGEFELSAPKEKTNLKGRFAAKIEK